MSFLKRFFSSASPVVMEQTKHKVQGLIDQSPVGTFSFISFPFYSLGAARPAREFDGCARRKSGLRNRGDGQANRRANWEKKLTFFVL